MEKAALIQALRRGEAGALATLVDRYGPRIHNFASRMCRSTEDAKDILQETFLSARRGLKDFRAEGKLSTWLFRIAANACRKMRRRGKFEPARHLTRWWSRQRRRKWPCAGPISARRSRRRSPSSRSRTVRC